MTKSIDIIGNIAAVLGIIICLVSGISRLMGNLHTLGLSSVTLFTLGIGLMVFACLVKLHALSTK